MEIEKLPEEELQVRDIIFSPNPGPQTDFLAATEQEILFGGSAGGGKSMALLADAARDLANSSFVGLIVRRTTEELRELIYKSQELYPRVYPGIKWSERKMEWSFPKNGGRLWMSYLDRDQDVTKYQGQAFTYIAFDELTQWATPFCWNYLRSRLRSPDTKQRLYMRACVDEGEVLTESGWKDIKSVVQGELVYSLLPSGELVKRKVTAFHEYNVNEKLVRIKKKNLYMSMTPDHRVVYKKYGAINNELIRFNEHSGKSIDIVRSSSFYGPSGFNPNLLGFSANSFAEFLGLYIAEGCVTGRNSKKKANKVLITQNKIENHNFVRRVMEASGCNVCYCNNGDFQITNKLLYDYLEPLGKAPQKHFPRDFLNSASREQLLLAFNAYALGDGHWQSKTSVSLVTCSKQLSEDLQEICVKLGYKSQVSHSVLTDNNHNDRYVVYVSLRPPVTKVDKNDTRNDVAYEDYQGKVYCLSVEETENFILRQKGCVWVSGNTTNPGGVGHHWVKKMFIDPAPWGEPFWATDIETGEVLKWPKGHSKEGQPLFKRRFIPSRLKDNPYLYADGQYEANLLSLPEHQRKQLLDGDWDVVAGAAFPEWNRAVHVIDHFEIPNNWKKFRSCDYGYGSASAVVWFAVSPEGQLIIYDELYVKRVLAVDLAKMILDKESGSRVSYGILDSSCWYNRGDTGPSIAEAMIREGCNWRPSDRSKGSRVAGKNELHRRLQIDEFDSQPRLVVMNNCVNTIAQLPVIPLDKDNPEDVDTDSEDHIYDAVRYGVMSRPKMGIFDMPGNLLSKSYTPIDGVFGY